MSREGLSTSTSASGKSSEAAEATPASEAAKIASVAGSPTAKELAKTQKHPMRKRKLRGRDMWVCETCSYSTFRESSADQHTKNPR
jgi:hypothetical protein